jgi:hypothetical protein
MNNLNFKYFKKMNIKLLFSACYIIVIFSACNHEEKKQFGNVVLKEFDTTLLSIKSGCFKCVKGQLIYLPVYSNMPHDYNNQKYFTDMSAFAAIHNTDLTNKITVTQVLYFNTDGKLIHDYLSGKPKIISPLATIDFYIPFEDKNGTGANFLIEWKSDKPVNEPLIETITANLTTNQSAAFVNQGKIIREIK